ncbi:MAG: hypothetical protein ACRC8Y_10995 [Chroococcales cyanobacterium]
MLFSSITIKYSNDVFADIIQARYCLTRIVPSTPPVVANAFVAAFKARLVEVWGCQRRGFKVSMEIQLSQGDRTAPNPLYS